jgi:hypothetical protein
MSDIYIFEVYVTQPSSVRVSPEQTNLSTWGEHGVLNPGRRWVTFYRGISCPLTRWPVGEKKKQMKSQKLHRNSSTTQDPVVAVQGNRQVREKGELPICLLIDSSTVDKKHRCWSQPK